MNERLEVTKEILDQISAYRQETKVGATRLLRMMKNRPDGLTVQKVQGLFSGLFKTFDKRHYESIIEAFETLPAIVDAGAFRDRIIAEEQRTGVSLAHLLSTADDLPTDLKARSIQRIPYGEVGTIREDHRVYILGRFETLPDRASRVCGSNVSDQAPSSQPEVLRPAFVEVVTVRVTLAEPVVRRINDAVERFAYIGWSERICDLVRRDLRSPVPDEHLREHLERAPAPGKTRDVRIHCTKDLRDWMVRRERQLGTELSAYISALSAIDSIQFE